MLPNLEAALAWLRDWGDCDGDGFLDVVDVPEFGELFVELVDRGRQGTGGEPLLSEWYVVMGEKTGADRYAMRFYVQSGIRWVWLGAGVMMAGALAGWWRGRKAHA